MLAAAWVPLLLLVAGCGESEGVAAGATVTAYVAPPLCGEAKQELGRQGGRAGEVQVRARCLDGTGGRKLDLATVGANARRATEDSTSVGYLEPPGPATRFARPILEGPGIAWVEDDSGRAAMARLLRAIREAGGADSLRQGVREALAEPAA